MATAMFTDAPQGTMPNKLFRDAFPGATDIASLDANNDGNGSRLVERILWRYKIVTSVE
ncbi:hypothetical protein N9933_02940 [bacterium]|nr:hypothetical protein [bacterium]